MGRACRIQMPESSMAHSTSCGAPIAASIRRHRAAISAASSAARTGSPDPGRRTGSDATAHASGVTVPSIRASPRPVVASMTTMSSPVTGSRLNATPEARASTCRWTTTAIASPWSRALSR